MREIWDRLKKTWFSPCSWNNSTDDSFEEVGGKNPKHTVLSSSIDFIPESAKFGLKPCETQVSCEISRLSDFIQVENEQALSQQHTALALGKSGPSGVEGPWTANPSITSLLQTPPSYRQSLSPVLYAVNSKENLPFQ